MLLGLFKVSGHSMLPGLAPDDRVVASSIPYLFSKPVVGDVVVFEYNSKTMIKRIKKFEERKIFVAGDNNRDSLKIGSIDRKNILGKVLLSIHY